MDTSKLIVLGLLGGHENRYILRDTFAADVAAGSVNGTVAAPGPGTRIVTDSSLIMAVTGGHVSVTGNSVTTSDPKLNISGNVVREAGRCGRAVIRHRVDGSGSLATSRVGWQNEAAFATSHVVTSTRNTTASKDPNLISVNASFSVMNKWANVWYDIMIRLRANGAAYYTSNGSRYRLIYVQSTGNASPLWFGVRGAAGEVLGYDIDEFAILRDKWVQPARVSDTFNRADGAAGTTDGLAAEEGGGSGYTWVDVAGALTIATNKAAFASLTGGVGMALIDTGETNEYVSVKLYRSAGVAGVIFKYYDANNYCIAYHDGTNIKVDNVVNGTAKNLQSSVAAYVDGAELAVSTTEIKYIVYYNGTAFSLYNQNFVVNTNLTIGGTKVGLYSTNIANSFDDFFVFDTYPYVPFPGVQIPSWTAFGDSLTDTLGSGALMEKLALAGHNYSVRDYGIGGQTTTQGLMRFASNVLTKSDSIVSIQMGVNNLWGAATPAGANQVKADLQTMYTAAKAAGKTVIAISLYPCKGHTDYSANVQANIDLVNAWIADTVSGPTGVDYRVDAYTILEDPANPDTLLSSYDDGGHLHLTVDGYKAVADGVIAVVFP